MPCLGWLCDLLCLSFPTCDTDQGSRTILWGFKGLSLAHSRWFSLGYHGSQGQVEAYTTHSVLSTILDNPTRPSHCYHIGNETSPKET